MSPLFIANSAASNASSVVPFSSQPRSPPWFFEPRSSEFCLASSAKSLPPLASFAIASALASAAFWSSGLALAADLDQDVRGLALLGADVAALFLLVAILQRRVVGLRVDFELGCIELEVFERDALGRHVIPAHAPCSTPRFLVGHGGIVGGGLVELGVVEIALLIAQAKIRIDIGVGDQHGRSDLLGQRAHGEIVAHAIVERARRHALRRQQHLVRVGIELAVLLERGDRSESRS